MQRSIDAALIAWKNDSTHLPLIIRGARQIGKTYSIRMFGESQFKNYVEINFELDPQFKACFSQLDPHQIIQELELLTSHSITPGQTLLFLDEVQECPQALMALRYFKEKLPDLHVIAAGSLLEFVFNDSEFRMPVGRVQFLFMQPLSFKEFLVAMGHEKLRDFIETAPLRDNTIPDSVHARCLELIRQYSVLGGMPAVIQEYQRTGSYKKAQDMQSILLNTYQNDFGKYAKGNQINYCRLLFTKAPQLVSKQFKFSQISTEIQSRELKPALTKLVQASVLHLVYATSASGLPLNALLNEKKMKLLFLDIGLLKRASHLDIDLLLEQDLFLINQGQLMEQLVGQELLASQDRLMPPEVYFWARDARGASAEVDFVLNFGRQILPIEVKSGHSNQMKSMRIFLEEQKIPYGIKISQAPIKIEKNIISLPVYLTSEISRLKPPSEL